MLATLPGLFSLKTWENSLPSVEPLLVQGCWQIAKEGETFSSAEELEATLKLDKIVRFFSTEHYVYDLDFES
jgi:hypothetical protein